MSTDLVLEPRPQQSTDKDQDPSDWVYQEILHAILEQRLAPGTKLGEELLSNIFAVSRPVVRRALNRLTHDNVVEMRPHRGAFIASPTVDQARQVFEARRVVEDAVVRTCVRSATTKDLALLRRHVDVEAEASRHGERVRWIRLSGEFHLVLARIAGNQVLTNFLEDLIAQTSLIIGLYGNSANSICTDGPHERIVQAIEGGNEKTAIDIMLAHLNECEGALHITEEHVEKDLRSIFSNVTKANLA